MKKGRTKLDMLAWRKGSYCFILGSWDSDTSFLDSSFVLIGGLDLLFTYMELVEYHVLYLTKAICLTWYILLVLDCL
jgi:hypothetical protein